MPHLASRLLESHNRKGQITAVLQEVPLTVKTESNPGVNHVHDKLKDQQLQVILNDEQIIDLDITKSKIKDRPAKGYISFQDEAKRIWYRNVRIKELK